MSTFCGYGESCFPFTHHHFMTGWTITFRVNIDTSMRQTGVFFQTVSDFLRVVSVFRPGGAGDEALDLLLSALCVFFRLGKDACRA